MKFQCERCLLLSRMCHYLTPFSSGHTKWVGILFIFFYEVQDCLNLSLFLHESSICIFSPPPPHADALCLSLRLLWEPCSRPACPLSLDFYSASWQISLFLLCLKVFSGPLKDHKAQYSAGPSNSGIQGYNRRRINRGGKCALQTLWDLRAGAPVWKLISSHSARGFKVLG